MRTLIILITVFIALGIVSFASKPGLKVSSTAFTNNGLIPSKYSCEGEQINPPIRISNIPAGTQSVALIVHDPDAPKKDGFTHWVMWNLGTDGNIPENFKGGQQGNNGEGKSGYTGMCPPAGTHRYFFMAYALDTKLNLNGSTDKAALEKAMQGHILAKGDLIGLYGKTK